MTQPWQHQALSLRASHTVTDIARTVKKARSTVRDFFAKTDREKGKPKEKMARVSLSRAKAGKQVERELERIVFVPDTHRPYHDKRAWELFMAAMAGFDPDTIVVMGDFADFYTVSSHSKDPRRAFRLEEELASVEEGLEDLSCLNATRKLFIAGNHCDRLTRYLQDKAPELFGVVDIPSLLKLKERGWEYTPYKHHTNIGKLFLTHDVGPSGRNAVFKALETFEHSVVTGHTHRMAYIVEGNAVMNAKVSAMFGHLLDVSKVDYLHQVRARKDWALGFGIGYHDPATGFVYLVPVPIVEYSCVVEGKLYRA